MEVLIIQKEAFEEMTVKFSRFTERVDALLEKQGGKSLNGQPRGVPTVQRQSANLADTARQRHAGLFANQPQSVLQAGGCDAHRQTRRTQAGRQSRLIMIVPLNPMQQ